MKQAFQDLNESIKKLRRNLFYLCVMVAVATGFAFGILLILLVSP